MSTPMKKSTSVFKVLLLAAVLVLGVQVASAQWKDPTAAPPGNNTPAPVNVGTVAQVKGGGLSVNAFTAYLNSIFKQDVTVEKLATGVAGQQKHVCTDSTGKMVACSVGGGSMTGCSPVHGGSAGNVTGDCPGQVEYYGSGSWINISTSGSFQVCEAESWKNIGSGDNVTVTNNSSEERAYLVIGQAFVGTDSEADVMAYLLKEGNPGSSAAVNLIGYDQGEFSYAPPGWSIGRPGTLQVTSVETIPAGGSKNFNGWVRSVAGGCGKLFGMKVTTIPL